MVADHGAAQQSGCHVVAAAVVGLRIGVVRLALAKPAQVGREHYVALFGKTAAEIVLQARLTSSARSGVSSMTDDAVFAEPPVPVQAEDRRRLLRCRRTLGHEEIGRHPDVALSLVADLVADVRAAVCF